MGFKRGEQEDAALVINQAKDWGVWKVKLFLELEFEEWRDMDVPIIVQAGSEEAMRKLRRRRCPSLDANSLEEL